MGAACMISVYAEAKAVGYDPKIMRQIVRLRKMKPDDRSEQDMLDEILAGQAMPGLMEPDDIAGLYLFLASDLASNITGQSMGIDRGEFVS